MTLAGQPPTGPSGDLPDGGRDLQVPPTPILGQGGGPRAAGVVLVAAVALIAVGFGAARLFPEASPRPVVATPRGSAAAVMPSPSSPPSPTAAPSPTLPEPTGSPVALPPRLTAQQLTAAVRAGDLDGRLVFIDGKLEVIELPCDRTPAPDHTCILLAVEGLNLPVNAGAAVLPWPGGPSRRALLVFEADRGRGLTYLGSMVPTPGGSEPVSILTRRLLQGDLSDPPRNLFDVRGYLVADAAQACPFVYGNAVPCPPEGPFLAEDEPSGDGTLGSLRGASVDIARRAADLPEAPVSEGIFLLALPLSSTCRTGAAADACLGEGDRWQVVGRYVPERSVRVVIP